MHIIDLYGDSIKVVAERSHGYKGTKMNEEYVKWHQWSPCLSVKKNVSFFFFRPPVVCEGTDDSYLFLKTDSAHIRYSLDSPGEREREREREKGD